MTLQHPDTPCGTPHTYHGGDRCEIGNYCEMCQYIEDVKAAEGTLHWNARAADSMICCRDEDGRGATLEVWNRQTPIPTYLRIEYEDVTALERMAYELAQCAERMRERGARIEREIAADTDRQITEAEHEETERSLRGPL